MMQKESVAQTSSFSSTPRGALYYGGDINVSRAVVRAVKHKTNMFAQRRNTPSLSKQKPFQQITLFFTCVAFGLPRHR